MNTARTVVPATWLVSSRELISQQEKYRTLEQRFNDLTTHVTALEDGLNEMKQDMEAKERKMALLEGKLAAMEEVIKTVPCDKFTAFMEKIEKYIDNQEGRVVAGGSVEAESMGKDTGPEPEKPSRTWWSWDLIGKACFVIATGLAANLGASRIAARIEGDTVAAIAAAFEKGIENVITAAAASATPTVVTSVTTTAVTTTAVYAPLYAKFI